MFSYLYIIILFLPTVLYSIIILTIIWQNKIKYQSRKINLIIGSVGILTFFISDIYLFPIALHESFLNISFAKNWIFILQFVLISIVIYILYYKSADKDGKYLIRN